MTLKQLEQLNRQVDRHRGCNEEWLERHKRACCEAVRLGVPGIRLITPSLFGRINDKNVRGLKIAWAHVKKHSGKTCGPDGLRVSDFNDDDGQICAYLRGIRNDIDNNTYRHGPTLEIRRPKRDGGYRSIHIQNLDDRTVSRAIVQVLQPLLNPLFLPMSFGFRPELGRSHMLAAAEAQIYSGRTVWLDEDLKGAFDAVPLERLLKVFKKYLPCDRLVEFVRQAITAEGRTQGIPQGSALSPLLLNLYLHHLLDTKWKRPTGGPALLRYADNLLVPCSTLEEAQAARQELVRLLTPAGFTLKVPKDGSTTIRELESGMSANVLGFEVRLKEGRLTYGIPEGSWDGLDKAIEKTKNRIHSPTPKNYARSVGAWLSEMGPAYADVWRDDIHAKIFNIMDAEAVDLRPYRTSLSQRWQSASNRWRSMRPDAPQSWHVIDEFAEA